MCIRDSASPEWIRKFKKEFGDKFFAHEGHLSFEVRALQEKGAVSYTHLRAHETVLDLVCRLLLEKKTKTKEKKTTKKQKKTVSKALTTKSVLTSTRKHAKRTSSTIVS